MVKFFFITYLFCSILIGQESPKIENPCQSKLIIKAKKEGLRSIKVSDLPQYMVDLWTCRKENGSKKMFKRINEKTYLEDYETSEKFVGFTATCAYCSTASVLIFYMVKLSGN